MTLPISERNTLISIAAALYDNSPLPSVPPLQVKERIYHRMWEVMDRRDELQYGEKAFSYADVPNQKKIEAVEKVLTYDVEKAKQPAAPVAPLGAKKVEMASFWDAGFDPRFSEDGHFLLASKKTWTTVAREVLAYALYTIMAYCSLSREGREIRKTILRAASYERTLSSYYVKFQVNFSDKTNHYGYWIPAAQKDFFDAVGDLYKRFITKTDIFRPFPSEVLNPLHKMNHPQDTTWSDKIGLPGWENKDLTRMGPAFIRLSKEAYKVDDLGVPPTTFDTLEHGYVPHYIFAQAIQQRGEKLKRACRDLRTALVETTTSFSTTLSTTKSRERILSSLRELNTAWGAYIASHEILTEAQDTFRQSNLYGPLYDALNAERKMSTRAFEKIRQDKNRPSMQSTHAIEANVKRLQNTKTARFLAARGAARIKPLEQSFLSASASGDPS